MDEFILTENPRSAEQDSKVLNEIHISANSKDAQREFLWAEQFEIVEPDSLQTSPMYKRGREEFATAKSRWLVTAQTTSKSSTAKFSYWELIVFWSENRRV